MHRDDGAGRLPDAPPSHRFCIRFLRNIRGRKTGGKQCATHLRRRRPSIGRCGSGKADVVIPVWTHTLT